MGKTIKRYYIETKERGTILLTKKVYDELVLHFSDLKDVFAIQMESSAYVVVKKEDVIGFGIGDFQGGGDIPF